MTELDPRRYQIIKAKYKDLIHWVQPANRVAPGVRRAMAKYTSLQESPIYVKVRNTELIVLAGHLRVKSAMEKGLGDEEATITIIDTDGTR